MIYFIEAVGVGSIKIGYTAADDVDARMSAINTGCPVAIRLLGTMPGTEEDERALHRRFAALRGNGEWFTPSPELLSLIPGKELPSCGPIEVTEQAVQIRVMTVGRKQFTKALLDQLPERDLVHWTEEFIWLDDNMPEDTRAFTKEWKVGVPSGTQIWGWVKGGFVIDKGLSVQRREWVNHEYPFNWVIFVHDGVLCKHRDWLSVYKELARSAAAGAKSDEEVSEWRSLCMGLYRKRLDVPGWNDQLFIGV